MKIVCIEGPHGCGKTMIIDALKDRGLNVLDEGFLNMPEFALNPQSHTMEFIWISQWITRALELQKKNVGTEPSANIYYADRSPFSALLYANQGSLLESSLKCMMDELAVAGIEIITCYISVHENVLWKRISDRLLLEPSREKYNEGSREWMDKVVKFYESHKNLWQHEIPNTTVEVSTIVTKIVALF